MMYNEKTVIKRASTAFKRTILDVIHFALSKNSQEIFDQKTLRKIKNFFSEKIESLKKTDSSQSRGVLLAIFVLIPINLFFIKNFLEH